MLVLSLNLITDQWIPVLDRNGARRVIAPWQMADGDLMRPDWPRPDLNIACLELLIGLVYLADPPADDEDWEDRQRPDPQRLRARLESLAPAFKLLGDGPRFLQDMERLEGEIVPVDKLFVDSAGESTAKKNADIMVHRGRYQALTLPMAAMALYTLQAHAPSGGNGLLTSMRGGGPLVTLVDPGQGLWPLIWANTPCGAPCEVQNLPWMRKPGEPHKDQKVVPPRGSTFGHEAFFGIPRRLRLASEGEEVVGFFQRPWGRKYLGWLHPLTPYYLSSDGQMEWRAVHPRPGLFGYRHWLGVLAEAADTTSNQRATCLRAYGRRVRNTPATVLVAGWAMKNATPVDFTMSVQPMVDLGRDAALMLAGMVEAAKEAGDALREAIKSTRTDGKKAAKSPPPKPIAFVEGQIEAFYAETEQAFGEGLAALQSGLAPAEVAARWLAVLENAALARFDALARPGLDQRETDSIKAIVQARNFLAMVFRGYGKYGRVLFGKLLMELPVKKKGKAA